MNARWQYKVVEVSPAFFGKSGEKLQDELNKLGMQGWELVEVIQAQALDTYRMFMKKEA